MNTQTAKSLPDPIVTNSSIASEGKEVAVFAGGCFWGMEGVFEHVKGVNKVVSGFAGGSAATAYYDQVSEGNTDHAEVVQITYDPAQISYGQLLKIFFAVAHDPTQKDRQGPDVGRQYRSAIFFVNDDQQKIAQNYIQQLTQANIFSSAIVTELSPLREFYSAEAYHQDFMARNPSYPYVVIHDRPKLEQLKRQFADIYVN
ncbi:MAG: peptide-methionine (S)-S-oxide reductase MsrA [Snowella sp.]|nr:peptide-methionine (S)-S-oxide reductase MsrA [Snowella sp.]